MEDGYLFLPQYFNIESNEVNNIENEVRKNGFVNDYVTTYYPEKLNGILQKLDEDLRLNEIVNHVKKKSSLLSVCRFYISEKLTEIQGSFLWHHDALFDYYKIHFSCKSRYQFGLPMTFRL